MENKTVASNQYELDFLNALLEGNRSLTLEITENYLLNGNNIMDLYENVLKSSLYKVGILWEKNKISVATEHLASALVETLLNEIHPRLDFKGKKGYKVLLSCVENEYHQIGIKMVSDIFESNGWKTYFLGANTPTNELVSFASEIKPDILAISMSIYFHFPNFEKMINTIKNEIPDQKILVGGQAFSRGGVDYLSKYENVVYLPDLKGIETYLANFN